MSSASEQIHFSLLLISALRVAIELNYTEFNDLSLGREAKNVLRFNDMRLCEDGNLPPTRAASFLLLVVVMHNLANHVSNLLHLILQPPTSRLTDKPAAF